MVSREGDRTVALSKQLSRAHQELRRQINEVKAGLGHRKWNDDTLVSHCLALCDALTVHHQGEDLGMFSQIVRERPDLTATVEKLVEDHGMISSILSQVRELAEKATESRGAALEAVGRELDGLAAVMESHFAFEERTISKALDAPDTDWPDMVFRFTPPD